MKQNKTLSTLLPLIFCLVFFMTPVEPAGNPPSMKVETGYYVIPLMTKFNTKVNMVYFGYANSGTKKVDTGSQQVLAVQFAVWNKAAKDVKVRRMDFSVNGQQINHFLVKETKTTPLVVTVPANKAISFVNYYIVDKNLKTLSDLKVVYSNVDQNYKKKSLVIPVIAKKK
jgi:hypothetical protein